MRVLHIVTIIIWKTCGLWKWCYSTFLFRFLVSQHAICYISFNFQLKPVGTTIIFNLPFLFVSLKTCNWSKMLCQFWKKKTFFCCFVFLLFSISLQCYLCTVLAWWLREVKHFMFCNIEFTIRMNSIMADDTFQRCKKNVMNMQERNLVYTLTLSTRQYCVSLSIDFNFAYVFLSQSLPWNRL